MGGESIEGFWVDGEPTAPFLAVEARTGCASRAIRIGMAKCYAGDFNSGVALPGIADVFRDGLVGVMGREFSDSSADPLLLNYQRWGLASVECSVSGTFFSHLPRATIMKRDGDPEAGIMVNVPYPTTCEDVVNRLKVSLRPFGEDDGIFSESSKRDSVHGAEGIPRPVPLAQQQARECVIFVHGELIRGSNLRAKLISFAFQGYNTPAKWSLEMLGQVLALGEFPSSIRPFVYCWPGGSSYMSFFAARRNAAKPEVSDLLVQMIHSLRAQGFISFHLIAHS